MSFTIQNAAAVNQVFTQIQSTAPGVQAYVCAGASVAEAKRATVKTVVPTDGKKTTNVPRLTIPQKLADDTIVYNYVAIDIQRDPRSTIQADIWAYLKNYAALASTGANITDFAPQA